MLEECNLRRYRAEIDGVFTGAIPKGQVIVLGDTPEIIQRFGAQPRQMTMTQETARKIACPEGYFTGKHNLEISALKQLPLQIAELIVILKSVS